MSEEFVKDYPPYLDYPKPYKPKEHKITINKTELLEALLEACKDEDSLDKYIDKLIDAILNK